MLSQLHCVRSFLVGVNQPNFVMHLAVLFCMTCTDLMMNPSVPPHTAIMYTIMDMKHALPTISLVIKLACLDTLFRADNLVFSIETRDFFVIHNMFLPL